MRQRDQLKRLRPDHKLAIVRAMDVTVRLSFARDTLGALEESVEQAMARLSYRVARAGAGRFRHSPAA